MKGHRDHSRRIILLRHTGSSLCKCSGYFVFLGDTVLVGYYVYRMALDKAHPSTLYLLSLSFQTPWQSPWTLCSLKMGMLSSFRKSEQKSEIFTKVFARCLPRTKPSAAVPCCFIGRRRVPLSWSGMAVSQHMGAIQLASPTVSKSLQPHDIGPISQLQVGSG